MVNLINLEDITNDQHKNLDLQNKKLILENEIYYKKNKRRKKIVLSEQFNKTLIKNVHNTYCHIGRKPKNGLMSHLGPATRLFEIISIDTIGGFGGPRSTKKYLHLLVDHFTRYACILTSKTQSSSDFIKLIINVSQDYNIDILLTDQYPDINSKELKQFLERENIRMVFTAVDAPFSNGLNERLNQTLVNKIRCKINEKYKKTAWTTIAQKCVEKYNKTEHTVTKFAPKYLLEGENLNILPLELKSKCTKEDLKKDRKLALKITMISHNYNKKILDFHRQN